MTEPSDFDTRLDPPEADASLNAPERELAARLGAQRALPRAEFRGALGRHVAAHDPGYGPRPERLRTTVALYTVAGGAVACLGALVSVGVL
jgi:hypothetical protein